MTLEIFLRYLHFVSVFTIVGSLVSEHLLVKKELPRKEIIRLAKIDAAYGIAALVLLCAGLTLWLSDLGKPAAFYSKNGIFHTKISLFILLGLLSIHPTMFFIKNKKGPVQDIVQVPLSVIRVLRIELILLAVIPLLAGLMAKGVGFYG